MADWLYTTTSTDWVFYVFVKTWPPNIHSCQRFHLWHFHVTLMQLLQHHLPSLRWNHHSCAPHKITVMNEQFCFPWQERCKLGFTLAWPSLLDELQHFIKSRFPCCPCTDLVSCDCWFVYVLHRQLWWYRDFCWGSRQWYPTKCACTDMSFCPSEM